MFNFDEIFFPTEEDEEKHRKLLEEIHRQCVLNRKDVNLVLDSDGFLYRKEPFGSFFGDCCYCSHYDDLGGMTEGGRCMLHDIFCGWGFTCKDNDSEWAVKI